MCLTDLTCLLWYTVTRNLYSKSVNTIALKHCEKLSTIDSISSIEYSLLYHRGSESVESTNKLV